MCGRVILSPVNTGSICNDGNILTILYCPAFSDPDGIIVLRNGSADASIESLMFEEEYRVRIFDRGDQQSFCIEGSGRIDDLQPRRMEKPRLVALRMKRTGSDPGSGRHPDDDIGVLSPTVIYLCQIVHYLVEAGRDEIGELHFHDAFETLQAQPQCAAHNGAFAQRRIPDPALTILIHQPVGDLEGAPIFGDVLSHQDKVIVFAHRLVQTFADGLDHLPLRAAIPSVLLYRTYGGDRGRRIDVVQFLFAIGKNVDRTRCFAQFGIDVSADLITYRLRHGIVQYALFTQPALIFHYRILFGPVFEQLWRDIFDAAGLFVSAHPEGHALHEIGTLVFDAVIPNALDRIVDGEDIVPVDTHSFHPIALRLIDQAFAAILFADRRTQPVSIVLDEKYDRQIPYGRHVQSFVEIAFAGSSVAGEYEGRRLLIT